MKILLKGGPYGLDGVEYTAAARAAEKISVAFYGQHLHFERTGEVEVVEGRQILIYAWSYSTAIAE
ncbi:DUF5988 family protein [Streptomyces sp. NPDC020379]|uniref:DUF5988 family protein n=1 Tax=Streptomyces sp. NPDC020379 TaxID=3365071 RepID=UPI0037BBD07B